MWSRRLAVVWMMATAVGCAATSSDPSDSEQSEAEATTFKMPAEGSCEGKAMLHVANTATAVALDVDAALTSSAAKAIVAARPIATLAALDAVSGVGPAALAAILKFATAGEAACTKTEIGIISDLDDTLIPKAEPELSKPPVAGLARLYQILEMHDGGKPGDVYYVTARVPDRVKDVPAYLEKHGVPVGPIETGTSGAPFIARPEKVRDMEKIFARTGAQRFVFFGDTTHVDVDVQKDILAKHPERVVAGIILKTTEKAPADMGGLELVNDYAEAAAVLYRRDVLTKTEARSVMEAARDQGLAITDARMDALLAPR